MLKFRSFEKKMGFAPIFRFWSAFPAVTRASDRESWLRETLQGLGYELVDMEMSRGGLMLRCVDQNRELTYVSLEGAKRHGPRPPKLEKRFK